MPHRGILVKVRGREELQLHKHRQRVLLTESIIRGTVETLGDPVTKFFVAEFGTFVESDQNN